jgi:hypothetical protein
VPTAQRSKKWGEIQECNALMFFKKMCGLDLIFISFEESKIERCSIGVGPRWKAGLLCQNKLVLNHAGWQSATMDDGRRRRRTTDVRFALTERT